MAAFPAHRREEPGRDHPLGLRSSTAAPPSLATAPGDPSTLARGTWAPPAVGPSVPRAAAPPRPVPVPRLKVTVRRRAGGPEAAWPRWDVDTALLLPDDGRRLHGLVDAVESAGAPAGRPGTRSRLRRHSPEVVHEVTVARGFGHWTVLVPRAPAAPGSAAAALAALVDHVTGGSARTSPGDAIMPATGVADPH